VIDVFKFISGSELLCAQCLTSYCFFVAKCIASPEFQFRVHALRIVPTTRLCRAITYLVDVCASCYSPPADTKNITLTISFNLYEYFRNAYGTNDILHFQRRIDKCPFSQTRILFCFCKNTIVKSKLLVQTMLCKRQFLSE